MAGDITYEEAVELFETLQGSGNYERWAAAANKWGADTGTEGILQWIDEHYGTTTYKEYYTKPSVAGETFEPIKNSVGNTRGYSVSWSGVSRTNPIDSNYVTEINPRTPINTTATIVEEKDVMTFKVGLRETGNFLVKSVGPAVAATGVGITLGKIIASELYDFDPDFWNSHDMSTLDPDTWNNITSDYDGVAGSLFDMVFGVGDEGTLAYLDADALAYIAKYLAEQGVFDVEIEQCDTSDIRDVFTQPTTMPETFNSVDNPHFFNNSNPPYIDIWECKEGSARGTIFSRTGYGTGVTFASTTPFKTRFKRVTSGGSVIFDQTISSTQTTIAGETIYYMHSSTTGNPSTWEGIQGNMTINNGPYPYVADLAYALTFGTIIKQGTVPGISSQDGADLPDTSTWTDIPSTKQSLQQQYPQLWDGAKHLDYVDENGQNGTKTLIPINLPNAKSPTDTQPTSGERTQDEPLIDPTTATKDLIDTITKLITGIPTLNPPTTGTGDGPPVIAPVGTASSLWAIYNPTQAQVNAFGAWLWDSSFVEQIKKLFNDPMQAIIGIHKVFASPSIGGTATIKVGYLDSQVSSAYVDDQYTTVNCGTVNLNEYFGNVFDYSPYTRVSLYLPFIGIVDLDVADVMRSSINVTYHVDVLSGACLADVKVTRDSGSAVLYQYSGSAIVTYPVSSGNYMGMVAGVLSVAGGVLGTIASGGALAPALIGGAVGASHLHTNVSHSGGFSGCAGAMASKKPYLIISRPQTAMAGNYGHFTGKPANSHVFLKDCGGMTKVKSVYVGSMNATDEEKDMIEAQLKEGVLI